LSTGEHTLHAYFTPNDIGNYTIALATVSINVNKETPTIIWDNPANMIYGTPLSSTQLDASASDTVSGASVPGTFIYTPSLGTILSTGEHTLHAYFTPNDIGNYTTALASVSIDVNKETPTIT
jgi:hypothetical protein